MQRKTTKLSRRALLETLRETRAENGLTQAELSSRLRRPQSFVSKYESGERRLDLLELSEICEAIGVSLQDFVARIQRKAL